MVQQVQQADAHISAMSSLSNNLGLSQTKSVSEPGTKFLPAAGMVQLAAIDHCDLNNRFHLHRTRTVAFAHHFSVTRYDEVGTLSWLFLAAE